ncbi:MAG: hypothetical protein WC216_00390 [Gallionella sp.]|jgi:hypothetical protein
MSNLGIIQKKIDTCIRLREYLVFSREKAIRLGVVGKNGKDMSLEEGDVLAAFRMRFSEYQEQLGKLLVSIAREEDVEIKGGSSLAAFAEKFGFVQSEDDWKRARDVRNNINHDYEFQDEFVAELTVAMSNETDTLLKILDDALLFCEETYGINKQHANN